MKAITYILTVTLFVISCTQNQKDKSNLNVELYNPTIDKIEVEKIIKTISGKKPSVYGIYEENTKIIYIETIEDDYKELHSLNILEKINNKWIRKNSYKIGEDVEKIQLSIDTFQNIVINNKKYLFFDAYCMNSGTAYNGINQNLFIYYDYENDSLLEISYSICTGQVLGDYSLKNSNIENYPLILNHTITQVNRIYGKPNLNINDIENYHLKWTSINNNIYYLVEKYANSEIWFDLKILTLNKDFFFSQVKEDPNVVDIKSSSKYLARAGFASPILAYSKEKNESYVLWIPADWPCGGAWGLRSFQINDINNEIIIASNEFFIFNFDLEKKKIKAIRKSETHY